MHMRPQIFWHKNWSFKIFKFTIIKVILTCVEPCSDDADGAGDGCFGEFCIIACMGCCCCKCCCCCWRCCGVGGLAAGDTGGPGWLPGWGSPPACWLDAGGMPYIGGPGPGPYIWRKKHIINPCLHLKGCCLTSKYICALWAEQNKYYTRTNERGMCGQNRMQNLWNHSVIASCFVLKDYKYKK